MGTGAGAPEQTPWIYEAIDFQQARLKFTVNFDNDTRLIEDIEVFRDPDCVYHNIYLGVGEDGRPESTPMRFVASDEDTTVFLPDVLEPLGLVVIEDVTAQEITGGP